MNWQELKRALMELFESFSLPFDDHATCTRQIERAQEETIAVKRES